MQWQQQADTAAAERHSTLAHVFAASALFAAAAAAAATAAATAAAVSAGFDGGKVFGTLLGASFLLAADQVRQQQKQKQCNGSSSATAAAAAAAVSGAQLPAGSWPGELLRTWLSLSLAQPQSSSSRSQF
jgi:hypothetical protein